MSISALIIETEPTPAPVQDLEDRLYEFTSHATGITDGEWLSRPGPVWATHTPLLGRHEWLAGVQPSQRQEPHVRLPTIAALPRT
jgi:hypothetical protein